MLEDGYAKSLFHEVDTERVSDWVWGHQKGPEDEDDEQDSDSGPQDF